MKIQLKVPVMKNKLLTSLGFFAVLSCGKSGASISPIKEAWNKANDPIQLAQDYQLSFDQLPLAGETPKRPWSDTYWPSYRSGIAVRWNGNDKTAFDYTTPTADELSQMSFSEIAKLSAAEKYDILAGRFDYPLVTRERERTSANRPTWEGICHGWSPAAINFEEPKSVTVSTIDGVAIPFGSSDVKALLSYYQGEISNANFRSIGERCDVDISNLTPDQIPIECRDTNAGAFHVVLTNQLGIMKQAFVADVTIDLEVWNQPVHGFKSKVVSRNDGASPGAARGTVAEVTIETKMMYSVEVGANWDALNGTLSQANRIKTYSYRVELNAGGEIIGGAWISEDRPDFLWQQEKPEFEGYFSKLSDLYSAAVASNGIVNPVN